MRSLTLAALLAFAVTSPAADPSPVEAFLKKEIIGPRAALTETQDFVDAKVPRMPAVKTAAEWDREMKRIREKVLKDVVFRGEAARWRDAKTKVERLEVVKGTEGYTLTKMRYEILPGFWIPALLYEPDKLEGKVPVSLAVNGHDGKGKAADYKQIRCINMAKRGMIVLNVEWLGMGQLATPGNAHGAMNQLDLCGSSGIAPFFLSMSRGLDLLLAHPHADPKRVAVSGLSGGGWQTIFISSLDPRVTLSNPVAGYSSFRTRVHHFKDLGDSEQTPCDLATVADYLHLTAMMAPRATLLTYNGKDNCCFEAGYALPPLRQAALPVFELYGLGKNLNWHINEFPGDHNFGKENRTMLYGMIGKHFFPEDAKFNAEEIDCKKEIKSKDELTVKLPDDNLTINALAKSLMKDLPRKAGLPTEKDKVEAWRKERLEELGRLVAYHRRADEIPSAGMDSADADTLRYTLASVRAMVRSSAEKSFKFQIPVLMSDSKKNLGKSKGITIILHDGGRSQATAAIEQAYAGGRSAWAADLWYFGEAKPNPKDWLWALMLDTVGQRPIGLQAMELNTVVALAARVSNAPISVHAVGPRSCTIALIAAALEPKHVTSLELHNPLGSFKEIIETNRTVDKTPELFCFGLLEEFDLKQIAALVAPRPIKIVQPSERAKKEFADLKDWYKLLGKDFDPLK